MPCRPISAKVSQGFDWLQLEVIIEPQLFRKWAGHCHLIGSRGSFLGFASHTSAQTRLLGGRGLELSYNVFQAEIAEELGEALEGKRARLRTQVRLKKCALSTRPIETN